MKAKSGKAVTAVEPTDPEEAFAADEAKPGDVVKVKAEQQQSKKGKYGSTKAPAFKPVDANETQAEKSSNDNEDEKEKKSSWIEIELLGEDDSPIPSEQYEITLPDGTKATGTLNGKGFARVEGFEAGNCKVSFPKLDKSAWENCEV